MSAHTHKLFFTATLLGGLAPVITLALTAPSPSKFILLSTATGLVLVAAWVISARFTRSIDAKTQIKTLDTHQNVVSLVHENSASIQGELKQRALHLTKLSDDHQQRATASTSAAAKATESATVIASAIEEMNTAILEIGRQADDATRIAQGAAEKAKTADVSATTLSDKSDHILSIVELIRTIAERTNLLALNATIEAARAGEHGKGFAVVASEVKTLAKQTADATTQIEQQINEIRESSHSMKDQMSSIQQTVEQINAITQTIKTALHEETSAAHEIATSAIETNKATGEVTAGISHMLVSTEEIRTAAARLNEDIGEILKDITLAKT